MATYSEVTDLLTGNIPFSGPVDPVKFVADAADEIDSRIGHIYQTPIDISDVPENPVARPARLLLKRVSNFLASGRLIMAAAAGSQKLEVNAYAERLVTEALDALNGIASGDIPLAGAPRIEDVPGEVTTTGPQIHNLDAESNVEAFYNRIANPGYTFFPPIGFPVLGNSNGLVR